MSIRAGGAGLELLQTIKEKGFVEAMWDMLSEKAAEIKEAVLSEIQNWLIVSVVKQATIKILSMLNPVGAIVQAILAIYDFAMWLINNWERIVQIIQNIVSSVGKIAMGMLGEAAKFIENTLANFIPLLLDFMARMLRLGNVSARIKRILAKLRKPLDDLIAKVMAFIRKKIRSFGKKKKSKKNKHDKDDQKKKDDKKDLKDGKLGDGEIGEDVEFKAGKDKHHLWVKRSGKQATLYVASDPTRVDKKLKEWEGKIENFRSKKKKHQAINRINYVKRMLTALDGKVREAVSIQNKKGGDTKQKNKQFRLVDNLIERKQGQMADNLRQLFLLFNDQEDVDFQAVYIKELNQEVHPKALSEVKADLKALSGVKENFAKIQSWNGVVKHLRKNSSNTKALTDQPLKNSKAYGKHTRGQFWKIGNKELASMDKDARDTKVKKTIEEVNNEKSLRAHTGLRDQVFDRSKEDSNNKLIYNVLKGNKDHNKFKPIILAGYPKADNPSKGKSTLKYTYQGGKEVFTSIYDSKSGIPEEITGSELKLHEFGRGVTQGDTHEMHDRAHLIANMLMGSGYKTAKNLVLTSSTYNQVDMKDKEEDIRDELAKIKGLISFKMNVKITFAEPNKDASLREIKEGIKERLRYLKNKSGTLIDKEKSTLEALQKLSDADLKAQITANIAAKKQARCMEVKYTVIQTKAMEQGQEVINNNPGISDKLGPDLLYGTA
ncbi:DNA/RNA non-specific endonuclease [Microscilla marina]|uniref:Type VII secretion system protein EssD-like domain-containing protein n=1 Tax=Microscilla marina ATCC 23134 TaxID=313606 RepID=A1ZZZ3_MICM2|nr:DNA/RNA non-specific endonuclease [Microscilla marina]EAY24035.1 hypothetical protein M23134_00927 [Microscilla marina ATCC 23134]